MTVLTLILSLVSLSALCTRAAHANISDPPFPQFSDTVTAESIRDTPFKVWLGREGGLVFVDISAEKTYRDSALARVGAIQISGEDTSEPTFRCMVMGWEATPGRLNFRFDLQRALVPEVTFQIRYAYSDRAYLFVFLLEHFDNPDFWDESLK